MRDSTGDVVERSPSALFLNDSKRVGHQRRYAPKTRSGCVTCKIRRVKCDEVKPFCRRCTSTGRKCDGYTRPPDADQSHAASLGVALVNDVPGDALERRTFDFFRTRTVPCVSGYYPDPVWDRIVLQLSHSEPAVRYAVNALGALHEERLLRGNTGRDGANAAAVRTGFPLQQYSKALKEMQRLITSGSVTLDTVLLCALICIHFESVREGFVPALLHAENAIQLLQTSTTFDARRVNPSLVRALMRIDLQGCIYINMRIPGLSFYTAATDSVLPNTFHDLVQARDLINTWTARLFHFMRTTTDDYKFKDPGDVPLELYAKAQEYEEVMLQFDRLLWDLMHKPTLKLSLREQHGLAFLRLRVKTNRILAAASCYGEASIFDRFLDEFQEVLTISMFIISTDDAERRLFSVSLDDGLIHPLFFVASQCRDSRIRWQAVDQMRTLLNRDGIWHVAVSLRITELCIKHEEAMCDSPVPTCADIPEWRRIHSAAIIAWDVQSDRRTMNGWLRTRPNGMDGDWEGFSNIVDCGDAELDPLRDLQRIFSAQEPRIRSRFRTPRILTYT